MSPDTNLNRITAMNTATLPSSLDQAKACAASSLLDPAALWANVLTTWGEVSVFPVSEADRAPGEVFMADSPAADKRASRK